MSAYTYNPGRALPTVATMAPFFGDMNALNFTISVVFYNLTFKLSKKGTMFWLNATIVLVFSTMAIVVSIVVV
ncbi:hypothetical protein ABZP36_013716 [Zizania latifolia]